MAQQLFGAYRTDCRIPGFRSYPIPIKVDDLENTIRLVLEDTLRNTLQTVTLDQALTDKLAIDAEIKPDIQRKLNSMKQV